MTWKDSVDPIIKSHLERQIAESVKHKNAYNQSNNPAVAQLWTAIGNLSKELFDINLKLTYLEKALKEIAPKKPAQIPKPKKEVEAKTKQ
ncbi:MAG: hypothetical protein AABX08_02790 [Nanoarchaeota archaeon]